MYLEEGRKRILYGPDSASPRGVVANDLGWIFCFALLVHIGGGSMFVAFVCPGLFLSNTIGQGAVI